jgi:predicted N-formylglutamate amidohydrolase
VLITCDHASNAVPVSLHGLGLGPEELGRHIGWDIGAGAVARLLAVRLDAPAILAGYSRLVIDCNRDPDDPTSIPEASDGVVVPGNRALAPEESAARRAAIFVPYHAAIEDWIVTRLARGVVPAVLSIHSFTPVMGGKARPWHAGVLWDRDPRIPVPLLAALRADESLVVGDNEPYSAREPAGYTVRHHAVARGLPHVAVELRQDLVGDDAGASRWAAILGAALAPILADRTIYRRLG